MKKLLLTAAGVALLSNLASANDYRVEIGAHYGQVEIDIPDFGYSSDVDYLEAYSTFYFKPVDTGMGPLKEAPFQNKASYLNLSHASFETDYGSSGSEDGTLSRVAGRYVFNSRWIVQAATGDGFHDNRTFIPYNDTAHLLGVGAYINDDMSLVFNYEKLEDSKVLGASFHALHEVGSSFSISYDVDAQYIDTDEDSSNYLAGGIDFYLTPRLNLGAKLGVLADDESDLIRSEVHVGYFVADCIELSALYANAEVDGDDSFTTEVDEVAVKIAVRF